MPWNNNNAEHAIKAFARLRKVIGANGTPKGVRQYLVLLSISETCKYKGVSFLDFLRSGEIDLDAFAAAQDRKRTLLAKRGDRRRVDRREAVGVDRQIVVEDVALSLAA